MSINNETNNKSLGLLTILEVGKKIKLSDFDAIKRWLDKKGITIYKETKVHFVYEIDVDVEIDKIRVKDLKAKNPNNWQELYRMIAKDIAVYEMVVFILNGEIVSRPTTKLKLTTDADKDLYKKLIA
ncbi:MAG: hypothetical protein KA210_06540 [Bacteroidia bacterium]|nr:hypothetical protein [Bacteroidia bacterium]